MCFLPCEKLWGLALTSNATLQSNHHIKRVGTSYIDSKPSLLRPELWFAQRHLLAGFANTLPRQFCNSIFVTVGNRVFLQTKDMPLHPGMEALPFYERTD